MVSHAQLQSRLGAVWPLNRPGCPVEHAVVALPSFSLAPSVLAHYGRRLPALEHRYLVAMFMLARIPGCRLVFVCSDSPGQAVVEYYAGLLPVGSAVDVRRRLHVVTVRGDGPRPVAEKLLADPDALAEVADLVRGRPAMIEPWNVTAAEVAVAERLALPLNGTSPALWPLGFKSAGRRVLREAGVPVPAGVEDVHDLAEVGAAVAAIRRAHRHARGVVVKHDNSGAGDGNVVVSLRDDHGHAVSGRGVRERLAEAMPEWYAADLRAGGVVERLVSGSAFASPSAQVDIAPDGEATVIATHEQVLGGDSGQVYSGCRFPADPAYTAVLAAHAGAVAQRLAARGARGRLGVDFVAVRRRRWSVFAIEVNLRKGGTTHPFTTLRHLVPGRYETGPGRWVADRDGAARFYTASDNLVDPRWTGLDPAAVIAAVAAAGLQFDQARGEGVVLHMLSGLGVDGRCGLTAIGRSPGEADGMVAAVRDAIDALPVAAPAVAVGGPA